MKSQQKQEGAIKQLQRQKEKTQIDKVKADEAVKRKVVKKK